MNIFKHNTEEIMENWSGDSLRSGNEISKILLWLIFFYTSSMKPINAEYRVISTKECIEYIKKNGSDLENNNWDYQISSGKGLIYTLSNGEFVLIPTNLDESYPGIIFNSKKSFVKYFKRDFFPIDIRNMTWLEAHSSEMKKFMKDNSFYSHILGKDLNVRSPLKKREDFEKSYVKLISYVNNLSNSKENKQAVINCYALAVSEYLITSGNIKWEMRKRYEMYNPYYYPIIISEGTVIDVISKLHIAIQSNSPHSFQLFCEFVGLRDFPR